MSELTSKVSKMECEEHVNQPSTQSGQTGGGSVSFKIPLGPMQLRPPPSAPQLKINTQTDTNESIPDQKTLVSPSIKPSIDQKLPQADATDEVVRSVPAAALDMPYTEPSWSALPPSNSYSFEILKGGVVVGSFDLGVRPYIVCGRHLSCDLVMEHPSISRYHSVIQYRRGCGSSVPTDGDDACEPDSSDGFYVYDLGSTHGTFLNKNQLKPRRYYRLFVGHMLRFGGSSRTYLMQGPDEECEAESELTVTEIQAIRKLAKERISLEEICRKQKEEEEKVEEDEGIDWGMGEDAIEEDDDANRNDDDEEVISSINPFALNPAAPNEDYYIDDPKKALRTWFEREGFELEYKVEEKGQAHFSCSIRLPLDHSTSGEPIVIEASVKGKKKEAVAACALEACRMLDRQGVLRQSKKKGQPRLKKRDWAEDDYYDSEEDTFLDRTGTIEKKRQSRMQNSTGASNSNKEIETYETLLTKYAEINEKLLGIEEAFRQDSSKSSKRTGDMARDDDADDLDAYMKTLTGESASALDKTEKSRMKLLRQNLHREAERLLRLMKIARPTSLPSLTLPRSATVPQAKTANIHASDLNIDHAQSKKPSEVVHGNTMAELNTKEKSTDHVVTINSHKAEEKPLEMKEEKPKQLIDDTTGSDDLTPLKPDMEKLELEHEGNSLASTGTEEALETVTGSTKKKRQKAIRKSKEARYDYDKTDPNYAMWIPPDDQMGDGRTSLNEKYGY